MNEFTITEEELRDQTIKDVAEYLDGEARMNLKNYDILPEKMLPLEYLVLLGREKDWIMAKDGERIVNMSHIGALAKLREQKRKENDGDVNDLVNQAMEQWDVETNCGENDPAFHGEVGDEIDKLVDGLGEKETSLLLQNDSPIIFVQGLDKPWPTGTYETCNYLGKVVYDRSGRIFTIYDCRGNIVAQLDYDLASMVASIFDTVSKEEV